MLEIFNNIQCVLILMQNQNNVNFLLVSPLHPTSLYNKMFLDFKLWDEADSRTKPLSPTKENFTYYLCYLSDSQIRPRIAQAPAIAFTHHDLDKLPVQTRNFHLVDINGSSFLETMECKE